MEENRISRHGDNPVDSSKNGINRLIPTFPNHQTYTETSIPSCKYTFPNHQQYTETTSIPSCKYTFSNHQQYTETSTPTCKYTFPNHQMCTETSIPSCKYTFPSHQTCTETSIPSCKYTFPNHQTYTETSTPSFKYTFPNHQTYTETSTPSCKYTFPNHQTFTETSTPSCKYTFPNHQTHTETSIPSCKYTFPNHQTCTETSTPSCKYTFPNHQTCTETSTPSCKYTFPNHQTFTETSTPSCKYTFPNHQQYTETKSIATDKNTFLRNQPETNYLTRSLWKSNCVGLKQEGNVYSESNVEGISCSVHNKVTAPHFVLNDVQECRTEKPENSSPTVLKRKYFPAESTTNRECYDHYSSTAVDKLSSLSPSRTSNSTSEICFAGNYTESNIKKKCYMESNSHERNISCAVNISRISEHIPSISVPTSQQNSIIKNEMLSFSPNVQACQQSVSWNNFNQFQQPFMNQTTQVSNSNTDRNSFIIPRITEPNLTKYYLPETHSPSKLVKIKQEQFSSNYQTDVTMFNKMEADVKFEPEGRGIFLFQSRPVNSDSISDEYILIEKWQCQMLRGITLPDKVAYVYNPLEYAFETHFDFISKFCNSEKHILFLGMNPGPWGMSQNGVPFGETGIVQNWLGIKGSVLKPRKEHPKRLIVGLDCKRSEVSGCRFWNLFKDICQTPESFFKTCFVYNMCPMAFMTESGKNVTPPQLTANTLQQVNTICDEALLRVVQLLKIKVIVGIGKYAYTRALKVMTSGSVTNVFVDQIMHPSPINPAANKGWSKIVLQQLQEKGLLDIIKPRTEIKTEVLLAV